MITGWDKTGPALYYVDADGTRLKGDLFSVGSGSTFAYGVLDQGYRWDMADAEAHELARRGIYAAAHRDAFSGNSINLYHVRESGWEFIGAFSACLVCGRAYGMRADNYDFDALHYEGVDESGGYGYDARTGGKYAVLASEQDTP